MLTRGKRLAQEAQLLAEERWIVDALKKIRTERNGLQIERLQLESMLALQKNGPPSIEEKPIEVEKQSLELNKPELVTICNPSLNHANVEVSEEVRILDDGVCNFEELNLSVTNPVFNLKEPLNQNNEFEEDEEEMDESDSEDMHIDINMFMNSRDQ